MIILKAQISTKAMHFILKHQQIQIRFGGKYEVGSRGSCISKGVHHNAPPQLTENMVEGKMPARYQNSETGMSIYF